MDPFTSRFMQHQSLCRSADSFISAGVQVSCAYHGWQFDGDGSCTKMPSTVHCRNVSVAALPCVEKDGFVWVWPGEGVPPEVRGGRMCTGCRSSAHG